MTITKKHVKQMDAREVGITRRAVNAAIQRRVILSPHIIDRLVEKRITENEVRAAVSAGTPIEVAMHEFDDGIRDIRVVLRLDSLRDATCVVVSLTRCALVTAWKNHKLDNHKTLDLSVYSTAMKVSEVLNKFLS